MQTFQGEILNVWNRCKKREMIDIYIKKKFKFIARKNG